MYASSVARAVVILVLATGFLIPASSWARADAETPPECTTCRRGGGSVTPREVVAEASFTSPGQGPVPIPVGSSYFEGCLFELVPAGEALTVRPGSGFANLDGTIFEVDYWVIYCGPGLAGYTLYPDGDPPPSPIIDDMVLDAYERTPVVAFNPITSPDGDDAIPLITQMTVFLWVDQGAWNDEVTAVAELPGFVVTAHARPRSANWSGGAEPIDCDGDAMQPYQFGIGGDEAQPSTCTMTFTQSSAVADQAITLEVTWDAWFTCSTSDCGGPLPDITVTSVRDVTVGEIQAVVTRPPDD